MTDPQVWACMDLWQHADPMVGGGELVIDRPVGSVHPKVREFVYPLDYGYIAGTAGGDGECVDVWVGSDTRECVTAVTCTIDPFKGDAELKLLWRCTPGQISQIEGFYRSQPQAAML